MRTSHARGAAGLIAAAALSLAGCGGGSHALLTTGSSGSATTTSAPATSHGSAGKTSTVATDPTAPSQTVARAASQAAGRLPSSTVATVAGTPITLTEYRAAVAQEKTELTSSGEPLDPPTYARCTAAIAQTFSHQASLDKKEKLHAPAAPSHKQLLADCVARERSLGQGALTQLIQQLWTEDQARAEGLSVSAAAVNAAIAQQRRALGGASKYSSYLARTGQTLSEVRQRLQLSLLEQDLQQRRLGAPVTVSSAQVAAFFHAHHAEFVLPGHPNPKLATYAGRIKLLLESQVRSQRSAAATTTFERTWRARTICAKGYVVPLCANAS